MQKMLARLVGETVTFEMNCVENIPCVLADESNLEQVLLNLVVNARDSMPQGGSIRVTVDKVDLFDAAVHRHAEAREGRYIVLTVEDNGCGMSADTQRHLFEPFFTTKPVGKGTGLGLSTVYGIIKQHEGWIEVQSELAIGTTFAPSYPPPTNAPSPRKQRSRPGRQVSRRSPSSSSRMNHLSAPSSAKHCSFTATTSSTRTADKRRWKSGSAPGRKLTCCSRTW